MKYTKEELEAEYTRRKAEQAKVGAKQNDIMVNEAMNTKIPDDPSLTPSEKENVVAQKNNRQAVQNSVDRNMENPKAKQGMGLKDQFLDALTFFGPQLLGGYLASGGKQDEYFVAGFNQGGKMRDAYLAQKNTEAKLEVQRENQRQAASLNKMDITPDFQTKTDGKPVWSRQNPQTGLPEFIDDQGNKYSATDVVSMKAAQDKARQEAISGRWEGTREDKETDRQMRRGKTINDMAKEFRNPQIPSGQAISALSEMDSLQDLLDSNTKIKGLIEFKMAKGVAREVGNLTNEERQAAAQIMGLQGAWEDIKELFTSKLSEARREEIQNLINYIRPRLQEKVKRFAKEQSMGQGQFFGVDDEDIEAMILRRSQAGVKVKQKRKTVNSEKGQALLNKLKTMNKGK